VRGGGIKERGGGWKSWNLAADGIHFDTHSVLLNTSIVLLLQPCSLL
jgi:hypothetical protein